MKKLNVMRISSLFVLAMSLGACGGSGGGSASQTSGSGGGSASQTSGSTNMKSIGILLPVEHDALNNAADGFITGLANNGFVVGENLTISRRNAQGNDDTLRNLAKSLVYDCDLSLGVGTGASQALLAAEINRGSTKPLMFTAVTDPVDAELVESLDKPGGFVTGSSDAQPIAEQLSLIKRVMPNADKVGIFYTQSESNSYVQAVQAKASIEAAGMECVVRTCNDSNDIDSTFAALVNTSGLDAIYLPTDNNVAANMARIKDGVHGKNILLVAGEVGMLENGAHITLSVDYTNLGVKTGEMAAMILKGEKSPADLPVYSMTADQCEKFISLNNLQDAGIAVSQDIIDEFTNVDK